MPHEANTCKNCKRPIYRVVIEENNVGTFAGQWQHKGSRSKWCDGVVQSIKDSSNGISPRAAQVEG